MDFTKLIEKAMLSMGSTPEERRAEMEKRMLEINKKMKRLCSECGAELCPYGTGHSFSCSRRGSGY